MKTIYSIYLVFALLFCFCLLAHSRCDLNPNMVQSDNHVLFVQDQLLRNDYVDDNYALYWACKTDQLSLRSICLNGSFTQIPSKCELYKNLKAVREINASSDCSAELYAIGFIAPSGQFFEIYRICYVRDKLTTRYSEHLIHRTRLQTTRSDFTWTLDSMITGAEAKSYSPSSVFIRFKKLLGPNQEYVTNERDCAINRGHLAVSADFYYMEHKRASFKYINVTPQFCSINTYNWKFIEKYIRKFYLPHKNIIKVKTIASGILKLPHSTKSNEMVPMYLLDGQKIPIPEWTVKILEDDFVFATYNNPRGTIATLPSIKPCSVPISCPIIANVVYDDFRKGYTICCNINNYVSL